MENASTKDLIEEVSDLYLERCMRIVPHDQNRGAFFFSLLPLLLQRPKPKKSDFCW
jgi:multisite-specific tRNA:(cytosine-C5)-methyltransferase